MDSVILMRCTPALVIDGQDRWQAAKRRGLALHTVQRADLVELRRDLTQVDEISKIAREADQP